LSLVASDIKHTLSLQECVCVCVLLSFPVFWCCVYLFIYFRNPWKKNCQSRWGQCDSAEEAKVW